MSIRRRLFLSFLVILALFAVNIVIQSRGNARRAASFDAVKRAIDRQVLVDDLDKALDERRQALAALEVLAEVGSTFEPGQIREGDSFADDLEADSLALIELVEALEEELGERTVGFRIEDEDLQDLKSVRDAVDYVESKVGTPS